MNNKLNLPPFYVGQKIVALTNGCNGNLIKNNEYTVKSIRFRCCAWLVDVGIVDLESDESECSTCKKTYKFEKIWWLSYILFAPIEKQNLPLMTFSQIKEKEQEQILINN